MTETPAPEFLQPDNAGGEKAHAAAVTNDAGQAGHEDRRESMGTAQGEGGCVAEALPTIDTESDASSYADALRHSVHIKQSDF